MVAGHLTDNRDVLVGGLADDLACHKVPNEMAMDLRVGVKEVHKHLFVVYESTSDERVRKVCDSNRIIVDAELFVDVEILLLYLFSWPLLKSEDTDKEFSIVHIAESEFVSCGILLD